MERLKDPSMLLSVTNTVALIGTTAYCYKQLESFRLDMIKMSQTITGLVRKITEMEKTDQNKNEGLHALSDQLKRINQQLEDVPTFEALDNLEIDLNEIVAVLGEKEIHVERPSLAPRVRRSGDRRSTTRRFDEVEERREERRNIPRTGSSGIFDTRREERYRPRNERQDRQETFREEKPRADDSFRGSVDRVPKVSGREYENDVDLIDAVRTQTVRN